MAEIHAAGGVIPFSRFMELALYAPGLGYYTGGKHKFGATGDFVTAPELGVVFARCLARQCQQVLVETSGSILEAGAGSGALAAELLLELERLGQLPDRYFILELSGELRDRQAATLQHRAAHLAARVHWLNAFPTAGFRGVVLGNELLDALPVERFRLHDGQIFRLGIRVDQGRFAWQEMPATGDMQRRAGLLNLPEGYESEIGFSAEGWVRSLGDVLGQGVALFVDYGFPRDEFYHPDRAHGTLMCHYRHRAHPDPLRLVGLQDMTAHVDFSAIATAACEGGLQLYGFASQALFLLGCGLDEVAATAMAGDARTSLATANEIKKLTLPHEMGELFKVIAIGRGLEQPLRGFSLQDRRARL